MTTLPVSVVVPSWGRRAELTRCVKSVRDLANPPAEIIVVDSPRDGSYATDGAALGESIVLRERERVTIGRARNDGAVRASQRYLLFLDSDNLLPEGTIGALLDVLTMNPSIGIVGPVSFYLGSPNRVWSAGAYKSRVLRRNVVTTSVDGEAVEFVDRDILQNAFLLTRDLFLKLGGFDDLNFTIQEEETEFQIRCREAGYRTVVSRRAVVYHDIPQSTMAHVSPETVRAAFRARVSVERLHQSWKLVGLVLGLPAYAIYYTLVFGESGRTDAIESLLAGLTVLSGTASGLLHEPLIKRSFLLDS